MATRVQDLQVRPMRGRGRPNGGRQQAVAQRNGQPVMDMASQYFAPERQWLTQRGPQLAKLAQQVKMVTALVNAEKQFFDTFGAVNPVVTPTGQTLNLIPEGDDSQGRQGRSIRAKEISVRLNFYSATAATASQAVRVILIKDNLPQGSVVNVGTIFQGGVAGVNNMPALDVQQGRFKWLFDETFTLGILAGGQDAKVIHFDLKLDHHINFIGSTGAVASIGQGSLILFVLTDTVSGNASTGAYYSRLRYYDN